MAIDVMDGFEHGVASIVGGGLSTAIGVPTGGAVELTSTAAKDGNRGLRIFSGTTAGYFTSQSATETSKRSFGFHMKIVALPNTTANVWYAYGGATVFVDWQALYIQTDGRLLLKATDGATATQGPILSAGVWYWIDLWVDTTTTAAQVKMRVDGGAEYTNSGTLSVAGPTGVSSWQVEANTAYERYVDNYVSGADADYPIGPRYILGYNVDGVGSHNLDAATSAYFFQNAGSDVAIATSDSTSNQRIDDFPGDAGTDYVTVKPAAGPTEPTATWYLEYTLLNTVETVTISAVRGIISVMDSASGASTGAAKLYEGGSETSFWPGNAGSVRQYNSGVLATKPSGGAWDYTALNDLKLRWGYSNDATPNPQLYAAMIEVAFQSGVTQVLLPDGDLAAGGWTTSPLWSKLSDSSDATVVTATAS